MYHPHYDHGFADDSGAPQDVMHEARQRGIIFDVGHGVGSFGWNVAEGACQQHDFWPDTISTDIHKFNLHGPVFDLTTTMSKFLHLGMPLEKVIRATTLEPARAMRLSDRFGRLAPGRPADVTLLRLVRGSFGLIDVKQQERVASERLVAVMAFKNGQRSDCVQDEI
jgi:dihydroorotase